MRPNILAPILAMALMVGACGDAVSADPAPSPAPSPAPAPAATPVPSPAPQMADGALGTAPALAQGWTIQPESSTLAFSALQEGERFTGAFTEFSGDIAFDPNDLPGSRVRIEIPLKSVSAGSKDRDSTLPGKVWFNVKANPVATYRANEFVATDTGYEARGTLSLKGVKRPLTLPFTVKIEGDRAEMMGKVTLDRTLWKVGAKPWDTDEWVSRAVDLDIRVTAIKS